MVSKLLRENGNTAPVSQPTSASQTQPTQPVLDIVGLEGLKQYFQKIGIDLNDNKNPTASIVKEWISANCDMPQTPDITELNDVSDPDIKEPLDMLNNVDKATLAEVLGEINSGKISDNTRNVIKAQFEQALNSINGAQ